jgi:hypothetical protein
MPHRVNTPERVESAREKISEFLDAHAEWFCTFNGGATDALARRELDIAVAHGRLILNCWTEKGNRSWRISTWELAEEKVLLQASRRMGAERPLIELVPRSSAGAIALTVKAARQTRCELLGQLACSIAPGSKLERCALSPGARRGQPGRYARIVLQLRHHRIAVTGSVASSHASDADSFLAAALLWFKRTSERVRPPYFEHLWLVVETALTKPTIQRVALLRQSLQDPISVYEVDEKLSELKLVDIPTRVELWKRRLARFPPAMPTESSEITKRLIEFAPEAIDVVYARHGQTLRYLGMPFARVRSVMGEERVWFGVEGSRRRMLGKETEDECISLLTDLMDHRSADALDHHHALYRNAGEAWLESLLRRDITRLDPGLIIAPLHAQFRIARAGSSGVAPGVRPIDLLALRRDGRLAVIELKVTEAREHVFQGADYWQRVEAHRRRGHITRARLFGDRKISNEPPLIYLVAPTLRVHPAFNTLAHFIAPDIEIYRFDINEDWRSGVRVMRRMRVN